MCFAAYHLSYKVSRARYERGRWGLDVLAGQTEMRIYVKSITIGLIAAVFLGPFVNAVLSHSTQDECRLFYNESRCLAEFPPKFITKIHVSRDQIFYMIIYAITNVRAPVLFGDIYRVATPNQHIYFVSYMGVVVDIQVVSQDPTRGSLKNMSYNAVFQRIKMAKTVPELYRLMHEFGGEKVEFEGVNGITISAIRQHTLEDVFIRRLAPAILVIALKDGDRIVSFEHLGLDPRRAI